MENEIKDKPEKAKPPHVVVKNTADYQRMKLEKLMKNPDKPVLIPERPKERGSPHVPDFVRNVMGSSAGAGSGEFHVYRHLRRKEYARQKFMQERAAKDKQDEEYRGRLEENKRLADERTAKKRAKRLKKNKNQKKGNKKTKINKESSSEKTEESSSDEESESREHETSENSSGVAEIQRRAVDKAESTMVESTTVETNKSNVFTGIKINKEETAAEELTKNE